MANATPAVSPLCGSSELNRLEGDELVFGYGSVDYMMGDWAMIQSTAGSARTMRCSMAMRATTR